MHGHVHVLQWLSSVGVLHSLVDCTGQTAAHVAARRGEFAVLRYMCETLHADITQEDFEGRIPLDCVPKRSLQGNDEALEQTRQYLLSFVGVLERS